MIESYEDLIKVAKHVKVEPFKRYNVDSNVEKVYILFSERYERYNWDQSSEYILGAYSTEDQAFKAINKHVELIHKGNLKAKEELESYRRKMIEDEGEDMDLDDEPIPHYNSALWEDWELDDEENYTTYTYRIKEVALDSYMEE